MSTRGVVAYTNEDGDVRGIYVHHGSLEDTLPTLRKRLAEEGYDAMTEWVENGITKGHYSTVSDTDPKIDAEGGGFSFDVTKQEYGYMIEQDGVRLIHSDHHTEDEMSYINWLFGNVIPSVETLEADEKIAEGLRLEIAQMRAVTPATA